MPPGDRKPECCRDDFCEQRPEGDAGHVPAETEDEERIERYVRQVEHQLQYEPDVGAAEADEPAEQGKVHQRRRRGPDSDVEVVPGELFNLRAGVEEKKRNPT